MSRIIDISQTLSSEIATWPGDTEYATFWKMRLEDGDSCNVGSVTMSLHTGTHADAPFHFLSEGESIADADLSHYIGVATVIDATGAEVISASHVKNVNLRAARLLFKTGTASSDKFDDAFCYFAPETAEMLATGGVQLVGIDTPSVDKSDSTTLDSHKTFAKSNIAILENLNLTDVEPGDYELIALPLKIAGMDASPVRAILRSPDK